MKFKLQNRDNDILEFYGTIEELDSFNKSYDKIRMQHIGHKKKNIKSEL